jgi:hypothetical protein
MLRAAGSLEELVELTRQQNTAKTRSKAAPRPCSRSAGPDGSRRRQTATRSGSAASVELAAGCST